MPYNGSDNDSGFPHFGSQLARTGKRFTGLYTYSPDLASGGSYREYIQVKLLEKLIPGETYCAKMYVSRAEFTGYANNNLGIYFGDSMKIYGFGKNLSKIPQIVEPQIITDSQNWVLVSGTFKATAPSQFMIIGNFSNDDNTSVLALPGNPNFYPNNGYYYVEDVSVINISSKKLEFQSDRIVCPGLLGSVAVMGDFDEITWTTLNDTLSVLGKNNKLTLPILAKTTYRVKVDRCGAILKDTISINIRPPLNINLGNDSTLCAGKTLLLDATLPGTAAQWQDNSTGGRLLVTKAGLYSVMVTDEFNCSKKDEILITYRNPPVANLGNDTLLCGTRMQLIGSNGDQYQWSTGSTEPKIVVATSGRYWLSIENQCGISSDTVDLSSFSDIFIPNVITPNGDLANDQFKITGIGKEFKASLRIINRNGTEIFYSNAYNNEWPSPQQPTPEGTYFFLLSLSGCNEYRGWLQVIK